MYTGTCSGAGLRTEGAFGDRAPGRDEHALIDASVHIFFGSTPELRTVMREPFKSRGFPDYEMDWYWRPGGEYVRAPAVPTAVPRIGSRRRRAAPVHRPRRRRGGAAPDGPRHHARPPSGHRDPWPRTTR